MPVLLLHIYLLTSLEWFMVIIIVSWLYATACAVGMPADMIWLCGAFHWAIQRLIGHRAANHDQQNKLGPLMSQESIEVDILQLPVRSDDLSYSQASCNRRQWINEPLTALTRIIGDTFIDVFLRFISQLLW